MQKQPTQQELRLGSVANFETIVTIRQLASPSATVELKFEAVFAGAKSQRARQTKAQFFINPSDLNNLQLAIASLSSDTQGRR